MNKNKIENFFDDVEISEEAKEFWARVSSKFSKEEIEAFNILKKGSSKDIEKVIDILMRKEKAVIENNFKELKNIFEEEKEMFKNLF